MKRDLAFPSVVQQRGLTAGCSTVLSTSVNTDLKRLSGTQRPTPLHKIETHFVTRVQFHLLKIKSSMFVLHNCNNVLDDVLGYPNYI